VYLKSLQGGDLSTGRNRIAFEVMKRLLTHFFDKEKQAAGFKILMLEEKIDNLYLPFSVKGQDYAARLTGHIDRVDIAKEQICRVIDYKTGKVNPLNLKSVAEMSGAQAVERREAFQLFFYRYLLKRTWTRGSLYPFRLGIYPFKKMFENLTFIRVDKTDIIDDGMVEEFEQILLNLFRELFDPGMPFSRTGTEKNCRYCPYTNPCGRPQPETFM
jgi:hypothetical protein